MRWMTKFSFAVIWWETTVRAGDPTRLNQLIRKSGSVIGCIVKKGSVWMTLLQLWIGVMHPSVCTCCLTRCLHLTVLMLSNRGMSGDVSLFNSSAVAVATWSTQWLGGPCDIIQEKKPCQSPSSVRLLSGWLSLARFLPYPHSAHSRAHTCAALTIIT